MATAPHLRRRARSLVAAAVAMVVGGAGLVATGPAAQAAPSTTGKDKVQPELAAQMTTRGGADFWVRFDARADLTAASKIKDWSKRGTAVAAALKKAAARSQASVRAELDREGAVYQPFWATNAIKISKGSTSLMQSLAARSEVEGLYAAMTIEAPKVTEGAGAKATSAVEWGIANIKADQVWSQWGDTGAGITVASIDSGVQFDHPALARSYRGNNGDGTFTHDYNWFDAAGTCGGAPCDVRGHGTHTMGTMVGADGENKIGVAPGARWITANGCCPDDDALFASGQWMLEPTDLTGANPDASKRPNIINNSWGTTDPSTTPMMEDITLAWAASGIFGVFANGNSGPRCGTSGSPGSLASNYSVGSYLSTGVISEFSSRGAGQNGELKPNISAPGENIRSSWPGSGYSNISGTSMAAPHVAGSVALLWSASPALIGDVAGTRALLDGTAVDTADNQCGGDSGDNNVYGEGELDARKLISAAPGEWGTLLGKITDAATGAALANATMTVTGAANRVFTTGADGTYWARLPVGAFQVAVTSPRYTGKTVSASVTVGQETTLDVTLTAPPMVTLSGTVTDGSGHGWPLYAKVTVDGLDDASDYTAPSNGRYSLTVPAGSTYKISVAPQYPGYETVTKDVAVGTRSVTQNVHLLVSREDCAAAPGYRNATTGVWETFDGTTTPDGWAVVDRIGNDQVWKFDDDLKRGNLTGGSGGFAMIDSDRYSTESMQDTTLISPVTDLTGVSKPMIRFDQEYRQLIAEKGDVDLSLDGGATWTNVLRQTTNAAGPQRTELDIPQAANKSNVRVRFHYYDASFAFWWQIDNVLIGDVQCEPTDAGLVVGHVKDANTGSYLNDVTVTDRKAPAVKIKSIATPDDPGLADGFFWLVGRPGTHTLEASAASYSNGAGTVDVEVDWVTSAAFELGAGRLEITPAAVSAELRMPSGTAAKKLTIANTGTRPVKATLSERIGGFDLLEADGSRTSRGQILGSAGAPLQRLKGHPSIAGPSRAGRTAAPAAKSGPQAEPWIPVADLPMPVMDNRTVNLDGKIYSIGGYDGKTLYRANYVYDPATNAWTPIAGLPEARSSMSVGVVGGEIITTSGWNDTGVPGNTWVYNPAVDTWKPKTANPAPRAAAGQAVVDGKLYAIGGCTTRDCGPIANDVVRYDPAGDTWEALPSYPEKVAFPSCGGIDGIVYCSGGIGESASQKVGYAFDPASKEWTAIADAPTEHWGSASAAANGRLLVVGGVQGNSITNAGFAYDPVADSWTALPNANAPLYRGGGACGFYQVGGAPENFTATKTGEVLPGLEECAATGDDLRWLSIDKPEITLAPGQKITVTVGLTASVDQPGTYTGSFAVKEDTPYAVTPIGATLTALPPKTWAKLTGTVTSAPCGSTAAGPLPGATVQVDSWASSLTFATDADGRYAYWLDKRNNPLTLIAAKDGFKPQARTTEVSPAEPKVENFALVGVRC